MPAKARRSSSEVYNKSFGGVACTMSDSSSTSSRESKSSDGSNGSISHKSGKKLCQRIQRRLAQPLNDSLPVADHKAAGEAMAVLKEQLLDGQILDEASKMCLTCAGIAIGKRIASEIEMPSATEQLRTTMALLFVLVVLASGEAPVPSGAAAGSSSDHMEVDDEIKSLLHVWNSHSIADLLYATSTSATSSWTDDLVEPGALCRATLSEAMTKGADMDITDISILGGTFFRSSASAMATALFNSCSPPGDDFLTLGTVGFLSKANDNKSEKLSAIADIAESEAGQSVLRDIILSFTLPRHVVGVRRTCLLTREANAKATAEYSEILNVAHEAAMRGAQWCWNEDENEVHKMGALLAGCAVLLARGQQSIRKDDAFEGRVDFSFLETRPPASGVPRMALLEATAEWVVYSTDAKSGKPIVQLRAEGFEGLCQAALLFVSHIKL